MKFSAEFVISAGYSAQNIILYFKITTGGSESSGFISEKDGQIYGNENSRIFTMKSKDLLNWEKPVLLKVKGDISECDMGRMIDPYILDDSNKFICFFKQNGVSFSTSNDLINWKFQGFTECGENVCVIKENGEYLIFNSPDNGINIMSTKDFKSFENITTLYLNQQNKPWQRIELLQVLLLMQAVFHRINTLCFTTEITRMTIFLVLLLRLLSVMI